MSGRAIEANFDGIVGPTHNYAGLSHGNLASQTNKLSISHPKQAALEGLAKAKFLADLGLVQGLLPPHERPDLEALRRVGFDGSDNDVLQRASIESPDLLAMCCSASSMWAANAATVSPSADSRDGRVHFTPANLVTLFHRALEPATTARVLKAIFSDEAAFAHHSPMPAAATLGDEGAANHMRLCADHGTAGVQMFVYGRGGAGGGATVFPARQTRAASAAIARLHQLDPARVLFLQQNPKAIDAGAFHNDVVAVSNANVLLCHEEAFAAGDDALRWMADAFESQHAAPLHRLNARADELSLAEAVATYLFNSQLISLADGSMSLIAPTECEHHEGAQRVIQRWLSCQTPLRSVHYLNVRHSMRNGGGPACLRLRVVLTEREQSRVSRGVILDDTLYEKLVAWVHQHYRDELPPADLADPNLLRESRDALDRLTSILGLGPVYHFQGRHD